MKKIVVIGGGTGVYTVLSGLKKFPPHAVDLSAIVTVADSGGSTGRLRDEFGSLPVGDFRMALAALAPTPISHINQNTNVERMKDSTPNKHERANSEIGVSSQSERGLAEENGSGNLLRELLMYRFSRGEGLKGHNFGNLLLTALSEMTGSTARAVEEAARVLRVRGKVIPVSTDDVTLVAEYADGSTLRGETHIDEPPEGHDGTQRITRLFLEPAGEITQAARDAILGADAVVLGPGDLYTSILANVVISGVSEALRDTKGEIIYITNLMTKYGQTRGFSARDHVSEITKYIGRKPDYVLHNTATLPEDTLEAYKKEGDFPVGDDLCEEDTKKHAVCTDFLAEERVEKSSGDVLKRSLIRHDSDKLARTIMDIVTKST